MKNLNESITKIITKKFVKLFESDDEGDNFLSFVEESLRDDFPEFDLWFKIQNGKHLRFTIPDYEPSNYHGDYCIDVNFISEDEKLRLMVCNDDEPSEKDRYWDELKEPFEIIPDIAFAKEFHIEDVKGEHIIDDPYKTYRSDLYYSSLFCKYTYGECLMKFYYSNEYKTLNEQLKKDPENQEIKDKMMALIKNGKCVNTDKCVFLTYNYEA